jgi:peptidyl-prolyl cis-trans isomerase C
MANMACASHILVKTEQLARDLLKKIDKGAKFDQLAKQNSTCPSAKKGGDLGEFRKGTMVPAFDKAVFAKGSEDKKVIGPIKTKFGFHLIQVLYKS